MRLLHKFSLVSGCHRWTVSGLAVHWRAFSSTAIALCFQATLHSFSFVKDFCAEAHLIDVVPVSCIDLVSLWEDLRCRNAFR